MEEPTKHDPIPMALSEVVGGPVGARAKPHSWWTPVRVVMAVFAIVFSLGLVQKAPCGANHWNDTNVRYGQMCYSDLPYLYTGRGFAEQHWPYAKSDGRYPAMEYPVLISYFAWGTSILTSGVASGPPEATRASVSSDALWGLPGMSTEINSFFLITAVLLFGFGLGAVYFVSGASPGRPWDAMAMAASPALLLTGLINWDLIAVFFTAGALWAWARGRPLLAGVMVGLGFATKLYPLLLLGAFLVDAIRRRRPGLFGLALASGAGAWLLVNLPAMIDNMPAWKLFWTFNSNRRADLGSFWLVLQQHHRVFSAHAINVISGAMVLLACAGVLALGLAAKKRPQVAQIAFLIVAAFLLVNKVYSPQYVLWLLPLAVLARPRWRDLLIWQACEVLYFASVWLYLGGWLAPSSGSSPTAYQIAILVRMLGEIYLMVMVIRDIWFAEPDADEWSAEDWAQVESSAEPDELNEMHRA